MRLFATFAGALLVVGVSHLARADEAKKSGEPAKTEERPKHRLKWKWQRFRIVEYGVTALAYEELGFVEYRTKEPVVARWKGPILFDQAFRNAFNLHSGSARRAASAASNILTTFDQFDGAAQSIIVPMFFDHWNIDVAWQLTMLNLEAGSIEGLAVRAMNRVGVRSRPNTDDCLKDPSYSDCGGYNNSFPSGHSMAAFTGAGLTCAHHMHVPLYGNPILDASACALDLTVATATSYLRIASDNHWASDVFLGGVLGFGIGFGLPNLLHYISPVDDRSNVRVTILPRLTATETGAMAIGIF